MADPIVLEDPYQQLLKSAVELYAKGADSNTILDELLAVKQTLTGYMLAINRANGVIDAIATAVAPEIEWRYDQRAGWSLAEKGGGLTTSPAERKQRALDLAAAMVLETGNRRITSRGIAERLQVEGDSAPLADLSTAVGNILSRSETWLRVGPGEYEIVEGGARA